MKVAAGAGRSSAVFAGAEAGAAWAGSRTTTILSMTRGPGRIARTSVSEIMPIANAAATDGQTQRRTGAERADAAPALNINLSRSSRLGTGTNPARADSMWVKSDSDDLCDM
jgi:hypothetical protein